MIRGYKAGWQGDRPRSQARRPGGFPWLTVAGKRLTGWTVIDLDATVITAASKRLARESPSKSAIRRPLHGGADRASVPRIGFPDTPKREFPAEAALADLTHRLERALERIEELEERVERPGRDAGAYGGAQVRRAVWVGGVSDPGDGEGRRLASNDVCMGAPSWMPA